MPDQYHISSNGKAAPCGATKRPCPLGGKHYEDRATAQAAADEITEKAAITAVYPRFDEHFIVNQARRWLDADLRSNRIRLLDGEYIQGFREGIANKDTTAKYISVNLHDATRDRLAEEAYKKGYARAAWTLQAKEEDFITGTISLHGKEAEGYPLADRRMVYNVIKEGEKIIIPAGSRFVSTNAKIRRGERKRSTTARVEYSGDGYTDGSVGKLRVTPPIVRVVGSGGYYETFAVTPALLRANNMPVFEAPPKGFMALRPDEY